MTTQESPPPLWSRRRLLTAGVLSLAWAVGGQRAASAPPLSRGPDSAPGSAPAGGAAPLLATDDASGRLTTAVMINGHGPYHFMVDTGAERTVIADDLAKRLELPRGGRVLVQGIIRGEPASLVEIRELRLGSLASSRLQVPTLPRAMLSVDGYLGLDVLDHRRVVFDFIAGTLTVTKPQGFFSWLFTHSDQLRVRTLGESGRLRSTDCLIDRVHAAAFFDTGAEVSIINGPLYAALQRRQEVAPAKRAVMEELTGVTGGSVEGITTVLDMVSLGDLILTFTTVVVADLPTFALWGLGRQPALLVGMDCLRRCSRFSIDYRRKEVHVDVANGPTPQPLQARLRPPSA
ncbi:MAG TPA: aspartyl protease family protein [Steroidobacteraceae bacterium]|nr:aspartyl protease family protein [Steroidobacteraceae bacterium]